MKNLTMDDYLMIDEIKRMKKKMQEVKDSGKIEIIGIENMDGAIAAIMKGKRKR